MYQKSKRLLLSSLLTAIMLVVLSACAAAPSSLGATQSLETNTFQVAQSAALPEPQAAQPTPTPAAAAVPQSGLVAAYEGSLENIYVKVNPSVVNIRVISNSAGVNQNASPFNSPNEGFPGLQQSQGSGFVLDQDGHIATNNHVVEGASQIEITFSDGTAVPAELVGADPDSDLAVIKVSVAQEMLKPIEFADSKQVRVGQLAIAIGNPFGLSGTMTVGIVSALERSIPAGATSQGSSYSIPDIIQTDAPINPGNSGGVLVNSQGQLIGVPTAIESSTGSNAGIGFAVPTSIVQRVVPALIKDGKYSHSWLGISAADLTPAQAAAMDLPETQRGALVMNVVQGSPAEKAGLVASAQPVTIDGTQTVVGGDVITAIDNEPVRAMNDLIAYLTSNTSAGQKVTLTLLRDRKEIKLDVILGERPSTSQAAQNPSSPEQRQRPRTGSSAYLGVSTLAVDADVIEAMDLPAGTTGLLVVSVQDGSPADMAGLKGGVRPALVQGRLTQLGGDVITAINGKTVSNRQQLIDFLANASPNEKVALSILREGSAQEIIVTLTGR